MARQLIDRDDLLHVINAHLESLPDCRNLRTDRARSSAPHAAKLANFRCLAAYRKARDVPDYEEDGRSHQGISESAPDNWCTEVTS